jgi:iodotyrosine deiodinase
MIQRAERFRIEAEKRRTIRQFSSRPIPKEIIENCLRAAGSAPSGANQQPWRFVAVSNPELKHKIRQAAELEEHEFYTNRATPEWLDALTPLGTDEYKPFLETAPYLIVVFAINYELQADGRKIKHYYVNESVGIATGILITALHHTGLATLTHTPSPMGFLNKILNRPKNERPFLVLVTGYPADQAVVPVIHKKSFADIAEFIE